MRSSGRLAACVGALGIAATASVAALASGHASAPPAASGHAQALPAAAKQTRYAASVSFIPGAAGTSGADGSTTAATGSGTFSAKLGGAAALAARVFEALTKVPLGDIAKGGSYAVKYDVSSAGVKSGAILLKFRTHSLGSVCLSFSERPGAFQQGMSFVPMHGSIKTTGGTARAARLRVSASFDQSNVGGSSTNVSLAERGSATASLGAARKPPAVCTAVGKL